MNKISQSEFTDFLEVEEKFFDSIRNSHTLEDAAQHFVSGIYNLFSKSVVLARVFATVEYGALPDSNKAFVENLVNANNVGNQLKDSTWVLSLMGTDGRKEAWKDRTLSQGHVGIPLISSKFIGAIPMMSRLLKQLGLGLDWIDEGDVEFVKQTLGGMSGVFYVPEAANEMDHQGRKVIAAQDFVTLYDIKTVFGFGSGYFGSDTFYVAIIFCDEVIPKETVSQFTSALSFFTRASVDKVIDNRIFV
jgi:hypothetical protein